MTPKPKPALSAPERAVARGARNIASTVRANLDVARQAIRGRQMRKSLAKKREGQVQRRSLGTAMGERFKYIKRMNEYGRKEGANLEDFGKALVGKEEVTRRRAENLRKRIQKKQAKRKAREAAAGGQ